MKILGGIILVILGLALIGSLGSKRSEKTSPEEEAEFQRLSADALVPRQEWLWGSEPWARCPGGQNLPDKRDGGVCEALE